ncbi:MAG: chemotaxis protein chel [Alphaproteobacteria bacterium CG11_big_fil_rev_8_21_14_0_20_44_7]|nr:MAG: chemotaxis protein chel [Alphaproteobacteria bacterium CG11_big_fil_rev_8_21_14_0_20_44_7]
MENFLQNIPQAQISQPTVLSNAKRAEIRAAAEDFEAMFMAEMLRPMFSQTSEEPMFGGSHAEDIYRSMMVDEVGKQVAKSGGIGIADQVEKSLLKLQEIEQ